MNFFRRIFILIALCLSVLGAGCFSTTPNGEPDSEANPSPRVALRANKPALATPPKQLAADGEFTGKKQAAYFLQTLDPIVITIKGPQDYNLEEVIDEKGYINLPLIKRVKAEGSTPSELEQLIQTRYIDDGYFRHVTVNVMVAAQSYYVRGEIKKPGRFPLMSGVRLLQAIATGGGFTEFANPKKVKLIRGVKTFEHNYWDLEQNPEKDVDIEAGDVIIVPRSRF